MNRRERRTAGVSKTVKLDRVIAVHEAGHAVARILAADRLGQPREKVISHIDVGPHSSTFSASKVLVQATTYGPTFSEDLQKVFNRTVAEIPKEQLSHKHIEVALGVARAEGVDVDGWLKGRMLMTVFASVAEAMHTGRAISEVWNSPESEGDFRGAVEDGVRAGLSSEQIKVFIDRALAEAEALIALPEVRRAIYALADALPSAGRMSGRKAYRIVTKALAVEC